LPKLNHADGPKAAVALVTLARTHKGNPELFADAVHALLEYYINELPGADLATMTQTLVILAANPTSDEELQMFARKLEIENPT
jgi:hypothetical protein